jgi:eukaryotic-like serine/threonine-protein kinase
MGRLRPVGDWIAGRYEIFAVHPGGMGVVYVAIDHFGPSNRKVVAIKTLRDEWLLDEEWKARFATEGELWVGLGSHPNIVHAYSVEEFDGKPHILLELITGGDLRKRIGTPELDVPTSLHLGIQFCLGMEHAIRNGLRCHRDVKPGNLMIDEDGNLKITDFGLAVIRDELHSTSPRSSDGSIPLADVTPTGLIEFDDPADRPPAPVEKIADPESFLETSVRSTAEIFAFHSDESLRITQTGSLLGTLPYMAPEQFRDSKAVDVRADIYAFGVVLFQMLTGELPFHGRTIARLNRAHTNYAPPSVVPSIPKKFAREAEALDEIVQRCLKKFPNERYPLVEDLRRDLTHSLRRVGPHDQRR